MPGTSKTVEQILWTLVELRAWLVHSTCFIKTWFIQRHAVIKPHTSHETLLIMLTHRDVKKCADMSSFYY